VFARLGANGSPLLFKTGGITIIAPNSSNKKRRVVRKDPEPEEHVTVYMIEDSDDIPPNPNTLSRIVFSRKLNPQLNLESAFPPRLIFRTPSLLLLSSLP